MEANQLEYRLKGQYSRLVNKYFSVESVWRDIAKQRFDKSYVQPIRKTTESFLFWYSRIYKKAEEAKSYAKSLLNKY